MALQLGPRIYKPNFKWGVLPRNKLDTLSAEVTLNTPLEDAGSIVQETNKVTIRGVEHTLPIALDVPISTVLNSNNFESGQPTTMCINQVSCVTASGSMLFELTNPLPTVPSVKLHASGTTYYINRGSLTHAKVEEAYFGAASGVARWIYDNASDHEDWTDKSTDSYNRGLYEDPTLVDYTAKSVPLYGWVRKLVPAGPFTPVSQRNQPEEADVLTTWVNQDKSNHWAVTQNWQGYGTAEEVQIWPVTIYAVGNIHSTKLAIRNRTVPISVQIIKIDDYTYRVDYSLPVRYEYFASSQYYTSFLGIRSYHDLDNYCFLDRITKIQIELVTSELNTETIDISYGLDSSGNLTEDVANEHPINFTKNELITSEAYWGNPENLWCQEMSKYLLDKFKDGKYIVECEVPATWALRNDIHINSELVVQLQDGTTITRKGEDCIFEVKTIEKRFRDDSFIFALRLMEV